MEEREYYLLYKGVILKKRYEIQGVLGEGGFGITYIGLDRTLNMKVAIKEFYPQGAVIRNNSISNNITVSGSDKKEFFYKGKEQFLQEARILAQFNEQEGIVDVIDFFEENNTAYIIMKYLDGITLKEYIKQNGVMNIWEILELLIPVMEALEVVHQKGVIHRDISPDNIMLQTNGRVKLMDFGAARAYTEFAGKSRSIILKPGYAPPEQYQTHGIQGPWTDIYALSATIYSCITGFRPPDAVGRVMEDEIKTLSELGVRIPLKKERALMKGMNVKIVNRYQNLREFYRDLYSEDEEVEEKQKKYEDRKKVDNKLKSDKGKNKIKKKAGKKNLLLAGSCLVVIALVIGAFAIKSKKDTSDRGVAIEQNDMKAVPNIVGANVEDVKKELEGKIVLNITDSKEVKDGDNPDTIVLQEPAAGEALNQENKSINVTVLSKKISIKTALEAVGSYKHNIYEHKYSEKLETMLGKSFQVYSSEEQSYIIPGYLVRIAEGTTDNNKELTEDGKILKYKPITLIKSKGQSETEKGAETGKKTKDIIGENPEEIGKWAENNKFYYGISDEEEYSVYPIAKGDIASVKVNGESVKKDTEIKKWDEVELVLSKGPKKAKLEENYWSGKTSTEVENYLEGKKLTAEFTYAYSSTVPKGQIIEENTVYSPYDDDQIDAEQKKKDGSRYKYYEGDTIKLTVSLGEKPQPVTTEARPSTGGSGSGGSSRKSSSGSRKKTTTPKTKDDETEQKKITPPDASGGQESFN